MSPQRSRALYAAISGGGKLNGVPTADLLQDGAECWSRDIRSDDVVVIRERNPATAVSLALRTWQRGAVPFLSSSELPDRKWWQVGSHSFAVQGAAAEWGVPEDCGLLQMTSGSSGASKMVMRGVDSILWESTSYGSALGQDWLKGSFANSVDFSHSLGWGLMMSALMNGCDVVAASPRDLHLLYDRWHEHSVIGTTPALLELLLRTRPAVDNSEGVVLFVGAGALTERIRSAAAAAWPSSRIVTGFGCTETGGIATGPHGIGKLNEGVALIDADPDGRPFQLKVDMPHEVLGYVGVNVADQYRWEFPDLIAQQSDGSLTHVARISNLPRRNQRALVVDEFHEYMSHIEREWRLVEVSSSRSSPLGGVVLVVESKRDNAVAWNELLTRGRELVDSDLVVLQVFELPRSQIGKIVYSSLLKLVEDRADGLRYALSERGRVADRTKMLSHMHDIAAAVHPPIAKLSLDQFKHCALSKCGMDSLGVMELVIAVQKEAGTTLPDSLLMSPDIDLPINWVMSLYPTEQNMEESESEKSSVIWW